jgi:hypothetical protein
MTRELRIVTVNHRSTVRQILREEVAEPHAAKITLTSPRPIRMSVEARDSNDAAAEVSEVTSVDRRWYYTQQ